ncbi:MAG: hypothetical protein GY854_19950 [Deltaproteobacteria bacterium]|nr:hypothetical protein [Deltaproteobacteria bacterium]
MYLGFKSGLVSIPNCIGPGCDDPEDDPEDICRECGIQVEYDDIISERLCPRCAREAAALEQWEVRQ